MKEENEILINDSKNDEAEIEKSVQKIRLIKFSMTFLIIALMVALTIKYWNPSKTYIVHFDGDKNENIEWTYVLEKEDIVNILNQYYASGVYTFEFEPLTKGMTTIMFICRQNGKEISRQIHTVRVTKTMEIIEVAIKDK